MRLTEGKLYRTRDNRKAFVFSVDSRDAYVVVVGDTNRLYYNLDGSVCSGDPLVNPLDLVSEWSDKVDSVMPSGLTKSQEREKNRQLSELVDSMRTKLQERRVYIYQDSYNVGHPYISSTSPKERSPMAPPCNYLGSVILND